MSAPLRSLTVTKYSSAALLRPVVAAFMAQSAAARGPAPWCPLADSSDFCCYCGSSFLGELGYFVFPPAESIGVSYRARCISCALSRAFEVSLPDTSYAHVVSLNGVRRVAILCSPLAPSASSVSLSLPRLLTHFGSWPAAAAALLAARPPSVV